jgi:hypothetical protein
VSPWFEVVLRGLMRAAAPLLPRTLAPNVAKTPEAGAFTRPLFSST